VLKEKKRLNGVLFREETNLFIRRKRGGIGGTLNTRTKGGANRNLRLGVGVEKREKTLLSGAKKRPMPGGLYGDGRVLIVTGVRTQRRNY